MNEAPTFKTDGELRAYFGMTIPDVGVVAVGALVMMVMFRSFALGSGPIFPTVISLGGLLVGGFIGYLITLLLRFARRRLPKRWFKHLWVWLFQPDVFVVDRDVYTRPLRVKEPHEPH